VRLLGVKNEHARRFYEAESLRGGWSVRQLDRQIDFQFYERTALSRNKAAMLRKAERPLPGDRVDVAEEIKDPFVLEGLPNKVMAAEYRTTLPDEKTLADEISRSQERLIERLPEGHPLKKRR
jgi:predicted nuclease of restriction endonuclease-like (RecB) superfamily